MIVIREAGERDAARIAKLFAAVFQREISEAEVRWKYARSWNGASFVAEENGRIVAHYGALPRAWRTPTSSRCTTSPSRSR